ncbi:MAG: hypothetical protein KC657_17515 [Myxococcales bacterium]|nr:hypothetical protein [Myxococcales bacterium]
MDVVRLTYSEGVGNARHLPAATLREFARRPTLRAANVLAALFHAGAVICEGDSDRAFYQEVNFRLRTIGDGIEHGVFVNSSGKGQMSAIVAMLRRLGIPAAAIVDFDVLKDNDKAFSRLIEAAHVPGPQCRGFGQIRGELVRAIDAAGLRDKVKREGVGALSGDTRLAAQDFIEQLAAYGVFIADVGELEGWLRGLGVVASKSDWPQAMFERLGGDPDDLAYVHPAGDDVWAFLCRVARWIRDPHRRGMRTGEADEQSTE